MDNPVEITSRIGLHNLINDILVKNNVKIIIVAGISGIDKKTFITNFIKKAGIESKSKVIKFEDELTNQKRKAPNVNPPTRITSFLNQESSTSKITSIEQTFNWISEQPKISNKIEYVFLDVHLTYYKNTEYFPPLNPTNFISWIDSIDINADVIIINLIDDIFNIWEIIKEKESLYPKTKLTLREILGWRSLETLQSESLSYSINSPGGAGKRQAQSYMVSVRHPFSTFKNLVFSTYPLTMYLSFPITHTRKSKIRIKEINQFREKMHKIGEKVGVATFDPVTIDELILSQIKKIPKKKTIILDKKNRWPLDYSKNLIKDNKTSIRIPQKEIDESMDFVSHQVRSRDLKLVESASLLAVYRPFWPKLSQGVKKEVDHATSLGNEVCLFSPSQDNIPKTGNPFDDDITIISNIDQFYKKVEEILIDLKKQIINDNGKEDERA